MKIKMNNSAISEIIGAMLLLSMCVAAFAVIYTNVLSDDGPPAEVTVSILGRLENGEVFIEHLNGESLGLGTKLIISLGGKDYIMIIEDDPILEDIDKTDGGWNIGETLVYSGFNTSNLTVEATVIDPVTNRIVMWGILQDGVFITKPGGIWHFDENSGNIVNDDLGFNDLVS